MPKTVEGELRIDNEVFTPALEDPESDEYRDFKANFGDALKHALFNRNSLENGDNEIMVEVVQIRLVKQSYYNYFNFPNKHS